MKTLSQLENELSKMYESYKLNPVPTYTKEYAAFYKKYQALQSKIKNYNSASNIIKRSGSKVTKTDVGYMFNGKNGLKVEIFADSCETTFWTMIFISGTSEQDNEISEMYPMETKKETILFLLELDNNNF